MENLEQLTLAEESDEYKAFVKKFKPKKTTDDCYTPPNIYEAVREWVFARYNLPENTTVIRPFYPGGDFERENYPEGCVVIDNPPFSIVRKIRKFYLKNGIRFFLFSPGTCMFYDDDCNYICTGIGIVYENGASVNTGFITNMGENLIETAPDLYKKLREINNQNRRKGKKEFRKISYPLEIVTSARMNWLTVHGERFAVSKKDALFGGNKSDNCGAVYGRFFYISERAAAERAAAERAAAERAAAERAAAERAAAERAAAYHIELSEREKEIIKKLGAGEQTS
jgi:hypothetical protein